ICVVVKLRVLDRRANTSTGGEVSDRFKFFAMKQISHRGAVAKIDMMNRHLFGDTSNVCVLDLPIVKIVEVVEDRDFVPSLEQFLNKMGADETSAAGDEDSHACQKFNHE